MLLSSSQFLTISGNSDPRHIYLASLYVMCMNSFDAYNYPVTPVVLFLCCRLQSRVPESHIMPLVGKPEFSTLLLEYIFPVSFSFRCVANTPNLSGLKWWQFVNSLGWQIGLGSAGWFLCWCCLGLLVHLWSAAAGQLESSVPGG